MKNILCTLIFAILFSLSASAADVMPLRGVVYDCGLNFNGNSLSVKDFRTDVVDYDMGIIKNILRCNAVRIEGESINRLVTAARLANARGLKVFFNPWKHAVGPEEVINYMDSAAIEAEKLRKEGVDITFITGCEYTLFNKGVYPGETFNDRFQWLMQLGTSGKSLEELMKEFEAKNKTLNEILRKIAGTVRSKFNGPVGYSAGTWENVDWSLFDLVGIDNYRRGETDEVYKAGMERYKQYGKPVVIMEFGCCAYEGAAPRGGEAFAILQGTDADGNGIYEGGVTPKRSEKEQADYIEGVLRLMEEAGMEGGFVYVFSYPIYPYRDKGCDLDMTSYSLVKSFDTDDVRSRQMPPWQPKEAFYRLGQIYNEMQNRE